MSSKKKVQRLKGQTDLVQGANIEALKKVGKEIESHLDNLGNSMVQSFWVQYKEDLEKEGITFEDIAVFLKTGFWKEFKSYLVDLSQNDFIRDKMSLNDYLAVYLTRFYETKNPPQVI